MSGTGEQAKLMGKTEAAYGVDPAGTYLQLGFLNESLAMPKRFFESQALSDVPAVGSVFVGGKKAEGGLNFEAWATVPDLALKSIMGAPTQALAAGETAVWDKNYELTTSPLSIYWYLDRGDVVTGKGFAYQGMYCTFVEFTGEGGGLGAINTGWVGKQEGSAAGLDTLPASPTIAVEDPLLMHDVANIDAGAPTSVCVRRFRIRIDRPYNSDRYCVGTQEPLKPIPNGKPRVTGELEIAFDSIDAYDAFKADTILTDIRLQMLGGQVGVVTTTRQIDLRINKAYYDAVVPAVSGPDEILQRVSILAFGNAGTVGASTAEPIQIDVTNEHDATVI
jgi:hypothetical protein